MGIRIRTTLTVRSSPGLFTISTFMHHWLLALGLGLFHSGVGPDPEKHFGESYSAAVRMYQKMEPIIQAEARKNNLSPELMGAIIFPELIRYNRFRDLMETTALENIYVRFGKEKADFSIGPFQMKPSFVEMLEQRIKSDPAIAKSFAHLTVYPAQKPESIRRLRVERISDSIWQTAYLAAFVTIAQHDYSIGSDTNEHQSLLLLATAYNRGIGTPQEELEQLAQRKTFPYGRNMITGFSYYDVARHFHDNRSLK